MPNPLTQVTDALWTMLEANSTFATLVPEPNRIKYDNRSPEKRAAQKADYPLVRIRESTAAAHLYHTSNTSTFVKRYTIEIATGEQSYESTGPNTGIHDVEWNVIRALADWPAQLTGLVWDVDDSTFIKQCRLLTAEQTLDNPELNRRIRGWSTIWIGEVLFAFSTANLIPT